MYEGSHVTPSQSFVLRYASRQSLVPYGTLVIEAPRAWEQNVSQRQLVFVVSLLFTQASLEATL